MAQKPPAKSPASKRVPAPAVKKAESGAVPTPKKPVAKPAVKTGIATLKRAAQVKEKAKEPAQPKEKIKKPKLVRDSFTMPEAEYQVLDDVKKACIKAGVAVKKSELLRVGVAMIQKMDLPSLKGMLATLPPLKAGRPKREK